MSCASSTCMLPSTCSEREIMRQLGKTCTSGEGAVCVEWQQWLIFQLPYLFWELRYTESEIDLEKLI